MNNDGSRKSGLPGRVGIVLAVLGALSAVIVAAGLAAGPGAGFPASAGRLLTRPLGWAALCLPVFLFAASGVLFLPGYRKDLLVLLSGAPLPFLVLVFLARFLAVVVPPELPEQFVREGLLPDDLARYWRATIFRLLGGTRPQEPIEIPLSEGARELFVQWGQGELETARAGSGEEAESYLSAWNAKFRGKALRLALLLHVLAYEQPGAVQVQPETMQAVLAWLPYLRAHNDLVAVQLRDDPDLLTAERVLAWIDSRVLSGSIFSRGALYKGLKGGNTTAVRLVDDVNGALSVLVDAGWLKPVGRVEPRQAGPPSARQYLAHPELASHLAQHRAAEAEMGRALGRRGL